MESGKVHIFQGNLAEKNVILYFKSGRILPCNFCCGSCQIDVIHILIKQALLRTWPSIVCNILMNKIWFRPILFLFLSKAQRVALRCYFLEAFVMKA